jgi:hypothetical protein
VDEEIEEVPDKNHLKAPVIEKPKTPIIDHHLDQTSNGGDNYAS